MAHRPCYCSPNDDDDDCHSATSIVRDGIFGQYGVEALLYKYGVDMFFGGQCSSRSRRRSSLITLRKAVLAVRQ